jgi:hypothetical protein
LPLLIVINPLLPVNTHRLHLISIHPFIEKR